MVGINEASNPINIYLIFYIYIDILTPSTFAKKSL